LILGGGGNQIWRPEVDEEGKSNCEQLGKSGRVSEEDEKTYYFLFF
jgi:hypothetical protein